MHNTKHVEVVPVLNEHPTPGVPVGDGRGNPEAISSIKRVDEAAGHVWGIDWPIVPDLGEAKRVDLVPQLDSVELILPVQPSVIGPMIRRLQESKIQFTVDLEHLDERAVFKFPGFIPGSDLVYAEKFLLIIINAVGGSHDQGLFAVLGDYNSGSPLVGHDDHGRVDHFPLEGFRGESPLLHCDKGSCGDWSLFNPGLASGQHQADNNRQEAFHISSPIYMESSSNTYTSKGKEKA
jgi:hypothetical protein